MAVLAAYVRNTLGARNLFWIEGPNFSASFAGMVQQHALLDVSGVVYAVHHPAGPADPDSWDDDFGYLVTSGLAPVVDGEWTNYEPGFLIDSYGDLADPTTINAMTWTCQSDAEPDPGQGAGSAVLAWFEQQNS
jgi:hypothetical protein